MSQGIGSRLTEYLHSHHYNQREWIQIAISIVREIGHFHDKGIIHGNLCPAFIMWDSETKSLTVLESELSLRYEGVALTIREKVPFEFSSYYSPEQIGRMNRGIDYRSDIYSIGVVLYELLTGSLPQQTDGALEQVHSILAGIPMPPHQVNLSISEQISHIVMKCLAKPAEERYQSTYGLKKDLERCLQEWEQDEVIEPFPTGESDVSCILNVSTELYGRTREMSKVIESFRQVLLNGQTQLVFIHASSGMGKSSLIQQLRNKLLLKDAVFISGRFDQLQRGIPYASIIQAFGNYIQQLLTQDAVIAESWKIKLARLLGANGQIIVDVIPEVESLLGTQPEVPALPPEEYRNRFERTFLRFMQAFASKEQPLVLFVDDWQWADTASQKILRLLLTDAFSQYVLVICASRNTLGEEELDFMVDVESFQLNPLQVEDVSELLKDTFQYTDVEKVKVLSEVVTSKTGGNPFFIHQFIKTLYRERFIYFLSDVGCWQWDQDSITQFQVTDNVVELLVAKLQELHGQTLDILKIAACIGNEFETRTLAHISTVSEEDIRDQLQVVLRLEIIKSNTEDDWLSLQFPHDNIRQAVYSLMDHREKNKIHFQVGNFLLQHVTAEGDLDHVFEIANHFEFSWESVIVQDDRLPLMNVFLQAAIKAKQAIAYEATLRYARMGLELLGENGWIDHYDMAWGLHCIGAECEFICGEREQGDRLFDILLKKANTVWDATEIYILQSNLHRYQGNYISGVNVILTALRMNGIKMTLTPTKLDVLKEMSLAKWHLLRARNTNLQQLHDISDAKYEQIGQLLFYLGVSAHFVNENMLVISMLRMLRNTIIHGNSPVSSLAYCDYGMLLCSITGNVDEGYRFAEMGIQLSKKYESGLIQGNAHFIFGTLIHFWKRPLQENVILLQEAIRYNEEAGSVIFAGSSASFYIMVLFIKGERLQYVLEQDHYYIDSLGDKLEKLMSTHLLFMNRVVTLLITDEIPSFEDENTLDIFYIEEKEIRYPFSAIQIQVLLMFDKLELALERTVGIEEVFKEPAKPLIMTELLFYYSLLLSAHYGQVNEKKQHQYRKKIMKYMKMLEKWSESCAENFRHKFLLVRAEWMAMTGQHLKAARDYEDAIQLAHEHGFNQNAAMGNELAAKFYLKKDMIKLAEWHLKEAHSAYIKWGATAKVLHLERKYSELLLLNTNNVEMAPVHSIDIHTVLKASQAISSEIRLNGVLKSLMTLLIRTSGANRGVLILKEEDRLLIEAEGFISGKGQETIYVLQSNPIEQELNLPHSIVQYVAKTKEHLLLHDAPNEGIFVHEEYTQRSGCKSMMCVPCMYQGKMIGIVYLENRSISHAFSEELLDIVLILAAQASISIINSRLYWDMEQRVERRTKELEGSKQALEVAILELQRSESARRNLITNISHDLRTPLQSVLGYLEALIDGLYKEPEQNHKYLNVIHGNVKIVNRLIEDLFLLSKLEMGQIRMYPKETLLIPFMWRLYQKFKMEVESAGINFTTNLPIDEDFSTSIEDIPAVMIDTDQVDRVVSNLMYNSIRYTPKGGQISMDVTWNTKEQPHASNEAIITVRNTGKGIATSDLPYIFDRFYRGEKERFDGAGSGLGLSICKEIVEKQEGRIWVESGLDWGCSFHFTLPQTGGILLEPDIDGGEIS
jgi:histidine kinase